MANQWPPPRNKKIQVQVPGLPYNQAHVINSTKDEPKVNQNLFIQFRPEARPERTEEELKEREDWVENLIPAKRESVLIRRHRTPSKYGSIITPEMVKAEGNKQTLSGTVLKMAMKKGEAFTDRNGNNCTIDFDVGSYVLFTPYAPFMAYHKYPEIQLIHVEDILFTLLKIPPDVCDD